MASGKLVVLAGAVIGVWSLGYGQGVAQHHSSPTAKPTAVVRTVVHTRTVTKTEYKTCPGLLDTANQLGALAAVITRDSGQHVDTMTAGGEAIFERNTHRLNAVMQKEYDLKAETDVAAAKLIETTQLYQQELSKCR